MSFFSLLNGLQLLVKVRNRKRIAINTIVPKYAFFLLALNLGAAAKRKGSLTLLSTFNYSKGCIILTSTFSMSLSGVKL